MEAQAQPEGGPGNPVRGNGQRGARNADEAQPRQGVNDPAQRGGAVQNSQGNQGNQGNQGTGLQTRRDGGPALYGRDPFPMMEQLTREMFRLMESFAFPRPLSRWQGAPDLLTMWSPEVDVRVEDNQLKASVDIPGVPKDNVRVELEDDQIVVQGERKEERTEGSDEQGFRRVERRYGSFYRAIPLPEGADTEQARANMKEGVLEITVPLTQRTHGRRLEVRG